MAKDTEMKSTYRNCHRLALGVLMFVGLSALGAPMKVSLPMTCETALMGPSGERIAVGGADGRVFLVSAQDGRLLNQWPQAGSNQITQLAWSKDGMSLLAVAPNRVVRVLDTTQAGGVRFRCQLPEFYPGADLASDGMHVATVTHDGPVRWYDVASGRLLSEWRNPKQPKGYSFVRLVDDAGLAVVAPLHQGDFALVDAAQGRMVARLVVDETVQRNCMGAADSVLLQTEHGICAWSRAELLQARSSVDATPVVKGLRMYVGGPLGRQLLTAGMTDDWVFWRRGNAWRERAWEEPVWDRLPFDYRMRPMAVDLARKRLWCRSLDGQLEAWDFAELGLPDALRVPGHTAAPVLMKDGVATLGWGLGYRLVVDVASMAPLSVRVPGFRTGIEDPKNGRMIGEYVTTQGVQGSWWAVMRDRDGGCTIEWRSEKALESVPVVTLGQQSWPPRAAISPEGLCAVFSSRPGRRVIGTAPTPETILSGGSITEVTVPAIVLLDPETGKPRRGTFNDHRITGVADVRWSANGRWIATIGSNENGGGSQLRVFSTSDGRRHGAPNVCGNWADFSLADDGTALWSDKDGGLWWSGLDGKPQPYLPPTELTRSARVAVSADRSHVALLNGRGEVLVLRANDGAEVARWSLEKRAGYGWQEPSGGPAFIEGRTILVSFGNGGELRKLTF